MIDLQHTYRPSDDIVVREIENELIIVPLTSGIADMENELYTLNETARVIWEKLDGKKSLQDIIDDLSMEYNADKEQITADVVELTDELLKRKMLIAAY
jgi:coenzyme PQQ biosynthesis protein PqqD